MQNYTTPPEISNPAIQRWKKSRRTPSQYAVLEAYLEARRTALPAERPSFKKFVSARIRKVLANCARLGTGAKELLDLIVIFGEGSNETLAEALRIEPVDCASNPAPAEIQKLPPPTMLEILGADINPDLFEYICTQPVGTTAQQFVDGCTKPAYLLIAMDAAGVNWETIGRITQATEKMNDEDACKYMRSDTRYAAVLVDSLNAMMK